MPESVQSCFELSIHLSGFFSREVFLVAVRYTDKCMENSKHDWTFSGTASSLQFLFLKSFY